MNFFQRDSVLVGIVVSLFFSLTMFYCLHTINSMLIGRPFGGASFRVLPNVSFLHLRFLYIIPFVIYLRTRKDLSMKGWVS